MDIGAMSMAMSQASLQNAVSLSVMKMQMGSTEEMASQMTEMMDTMAVDPNIGLVIDVKA